MCAAAGISGGLYAPLAMAYVPRQHWNTVYDPCQALRNGTIFPELNLPFWAAQRGGRG